MEKGSSSAEAHKANPGRFKNGKRRIAIGDQPLPNNINGDEGWQLVVSKRHKKQTASKSTQQRKPIFSSHKVQNEFNLAIKKHRCFICLAVGHQRAHCREPPPLL